MTEDYKKNLLDYATDMLTSTSPTSDEIIEEVQYIARSKWTPYLPSYWKNFRFEGMIEGNENTSGLSVLYGGYIDSEDNVKGIILLVNENFEPIKTFYEFESGTSLRYIQYMKQADDGTFYYIDDEVFSYTQRQQVNTSQKRFVMINNITAKVNNEYRLVFRYSYIFNSTCTNFYCHNMFKDPNSSHYIFFGDGVDVNSPIYAYRKLKIIELKVNIGQQNELDLLISQNQAIFGSAFALFNNDSDIYFRCVWTNSLSSSRAVHCYTKNYSDENPSDSTIMTFNFQPYIDEGFQKKQSVFMNINEVYFVQNNQYWGNEGVIRPKWIGLYKHDFSNNTNTTIYEKYLGDYDYCYKEYIMIDRDIDKLYIEFATNYDKDNDTADIYMQRFDGTWNPILIGLNKPYISNRQSMFAKSNFNLVQVYSYGINPQYRAWDYFVIKEDYNTLNYNGEPYVNNNVLVPDKSRIYAGEHLVFARNLYNISKQNNMTMSSVEIPSGYLNDITITQNDLISETNLEMNNDTTEWTKNIYEVVDVNFLNTISVIDEDTGEEYEDSAIKLNNATTDGGSTNYQNTPCNKFRINYGDGTSSTDDLAWTSIDDTHKETQITFYVDKAILSIDLLSHDTTTIYLHIPVEVEIGKTYSISQKIRIGG